MSQQVKKLLLITLFFAGAGWLAGLIVALDNDGVTITEAVLMSNPYRGMFSAVLWGWGATWVITKSAEHRLWWLWCTLLSPLFLLLAAQTYFFFWPNDWHGRAESYKTTIIFLKSYWFWMLPLSFATMMGLGKILRILNLDDLLVDAMEDIWESVVDISSSKKVLAQHKEELEKSKKEIERKKETAQEDVQEE